MKNSDLICPVCWKTVFAGEKNYEVCRYCGRINDAREEAGGANVLSASDHRNHYLKLIEANPDYLWEKDGFPGVSGKEAVLIAHKLSLANEEAVRRSELCGCFNCNETFAAGEITRWYEDRDGRTALCPRCGIDSVLPGSLIELSADFLEEMQKYWF